MAAYDAQVDVAPAHAMVGPHVTSDAHESPAFGALAQEPHPFPGTMAQKPLWHCAGNAHGAPLARAPGMTPHEDGGFWLRRKSEQTFQSPSVMACPHAFALAMVAPLDGAAIALTQ